MPSDDKQTRELRSWVNRQSHLPKDIEDNILYAFVYSCYHDVEKAKVALDLFFTLRASAPEIMTDRDPLSPRVQKTLLTSDPAIYNISAKRKLWVWQVNDPGLNNYDYVQDIKLVTIFIDALMLDDYICSDGDIIIIDCKDLNVKLLKTFSISVARTIYTLGQDALPVRLKQVHLVNAAPIVDKIFSAVKPFLKQEIIDLVFFHAPCSDTLLRHLSTEDLPQDYGGTLQPIKEQKLKFIDTMVKYRDSINDHLWVAIGKKQEETMDMGSFRTLDID